MLDEKLPPVTERWKYLGVREIVMRVEKSSAAAATLLVWFYVVTRAANSGGPGGPTGPLGTPWRTLLDPLQIGKVRWEALLH